MCSTFCSIRRADRLTGLLRSDSGQSIPEVPVVVVTLMAFVLMIMQPAVLLYDRMVLNNAAAETARVLVTGVAAGDAGRHEGAVKGFAIRRLAAIPDAEFFKVGEPEITFPESSPGGQWVSVRITVKAKPMPVIGTVGRLAGLTGDDGNYQVEGFARVPAAMTNIDGGYDPPGWVTNSPLRRASEATE